MPSLKRSGDAAQQRIRFLFTKQGTLRFISHLDLAKVVKQILAKSQLAVAYSRGFNPQPRLQFAPPLALGYESDGELLDVFFAKSYDASEVLEALNMHTLPGLCVLSAEPVLLNSPSLGSAVRTGSYVVVVPEKAIDVSPPTIRKRLESFRASEQLKIQFERKGKAVWRDLKRSIRDIHFRTSDGFLHFQIELALQSPDYVDPLIALSGVLGVTITLRNVEEVRRTHLGVK
jgi:radical SAM-linked protein